MWFRSTPFPMFVSEPISFPTAKPIRKVRQHPELCWSQSIIKKQETRTLTLALPHKLQCWVVQLLYTYSWLVSIIQSLILIPLGFFSKWNTKLMLIKFYTSGRLHRTSISLTAAFIIVTPCSFVITPRRKMKFHFIQPVTQLDKKTWCGCQKKPTQP